ncbi:hypothetical protein FHG87_012881 [Trinorchestia longiramus]|nr:hypothetical protein FHG87_012881 [Trinorchestia longiramus]
MDDTIYDQSDSEVLHIPVCVFFSVEKSEGITREMLREIRVAVSLRHNHVLEEQVKEEETEEEEEKEKEKGGGEGGGEGGGGGEGRRRGRECVVTHIFVE